MTNYYFVSFSNFKILYTKLGNILTKVHFVRQKAFFHNLIHFVQQKSHFHDNSENLPQKSILLNKTHFCNKQNSLLCTKLQMSHLAPRGADWDYIYLFVHKIKFCKNKINFVYKIMLYILAL